jgi:hypothetical protein
MERRMNRVAIESPINAEQARVRTPVTERKFVPPEAELRTRMGEKRNLLEFA